MEKTIVVVGGGASGLLAAITAARGGAKVTILEQNSKLGKKILSTGNGRCNFTNLNQQPENYRSDDPEFVKLVLSAFSVSDTLDFFEELGIYTKNRNGYLYPRSNQASSIVDVLILEARKLKIKCKTQEPVTDIIKKNHGFTVNTKTWHYDCDCVILACGSKASLIEGSNGSGYLLSSALGHTIVEPLPALTGLRGVGAQFSKWAGVRCDAQISLLIDNRLIISDFGELQLTDYGVSGIPVFQISRYAARALSKKQAVSVVIDFLPEYTEAELRNIIEKRSGQTNSMREIFLGLFPSKLMDVLIQKKDTLESVIKKIKSYTIEIKNTMDFSHAQVCTGGVKTDEINPHTMESKLVPGLYFCGELVDVDGACGGYNLQWAWSSGYLAGKSAIGELL